MKSKRNRKSTLSWTIGMGWMGVVLFAAASCAFSRLKTDVETGTQQWRLTAILGEEGKVPQNIVAVVYEPYEEVQRIVAFKKVVTSQ